MRAPVFWWHAHKGWEARLLAPIGRAYGALTARRMNRRGLRLPVPVICIGNLVVGGGWKTPTALAVGRMLIGMGERPAFLSRGYGRTPSTAETVIRVDPQAPDARQTGDEPILLAAVTPTYVGRNRVAAARVAVDDGATVVVLDDGLQNPTLAKTFSIAVIDGATGVGNGACLPAGPLRAPLAAQWPKVSAVCVIGAGEAGKTAAAAARAAGLPVWTARLVPNSDALVALRAGPLLAFAGIGNPSKFFATLRDAGLVVAETRSFADHHVFSAADIASLREAATRLGALLVTTEKDRVRLPDDFPVHTLPVSLAFDDPGMVGASLVQILSAPASEER